MSVAIGSGAIIVSREFRSIGQRAVALWPNDRRKKFLLCSDVGLPISIDKSVTPAAEKSDGVDELIELLGVALAGRGNEDVLSQWRYPGVQDAPPVVDDEWLLLGYDVCDRFETSALSNCLASNGPVAACWRLAINKHHLFERLGDADAFCQLSDRRIPEHAPFVVIAMFVRVGQ